MSDIDTSQPSASDPPRRIHKGAVFAALVLGAIIGGMTAEIWLANWGAARPRAVQTAEESADVAHLKSISPTQSHAMQDVASHWENLWWAAQKKNWPLAMYFFREARQTVRWAVLIRPVRPLPDGGTVDMKGQFAAIDPTAFAEVQYALEDQKAEDFDKAYRDATAACQSCHAAAGLPFIKPAVPIGPPSTILNFEP